MPEALLPETPSELPDYIPEQYTGKPSDVVGSSSYASEAEAQQAFRRARARMLQVNRWNDYAIQAAPLITLGGINPLVPDFSLVDKTGSASVGDVICIAAAGQQMFVRLEKIIDQPDEFALRVRTCDCEGKCQQAQHMYASEATTTFRLTREGTTLTTGFHGRNEIVSQGLVNWLADMGMSIGGREFNWQLLGQAWRPRPEDDQASEA